MLKSLLRHVAIWRESLTLDRERRQTATTSDSPEFLPAALEILERPPSPLGRAVLWAVMAFLILALAWACLGHVDMVATAQGKVAPRGRVKVIQPAEYGVVRVLHVTEGQQVSAGDPLVELDPTITTAEVEQARQALRSAEIDVARTRSIASYAGGGQATFAPPPGADAAIVALQHSLVLARVREQESSIAALRQERAQRASDLGMVQAEVAKLEAQLPLATEQLSSLESLQAQGYAPRLRVAEVQERVVGMRQDLAIRREEIQRAGAGRAAVDEQIGKVRSSFAREAYDALTEAEAARALRAEELTKALEKARHTVLTAPEAGVIQQLQLTTIGGVVEPAAPLMVLVPQGGELVIDARVLNRDAGFVREGQQVEVKLEAYPFTRYGVVDGVIEHISRDAVDDEKEGLIYPARVRISRPWLTIAGSRTMLAPGLAATVEIKTGRRRIIEYLLSPLVRRVREAGRER